MSSILKALKKIEGRKVDTSLSAWPFGTESRESVNRHIYRSRQRQKILVLLIILCGAILAVKLYFGFRQDSGNTVLPNTPSSTASLSQEPAEEKRLEAQKIVEDQTRSTPPPEQVPLKTSPETTPSSTTAPALAESAVSFTTLEAPETATGETFGTPPAGSAGLSLMALVWSDEPESRFAVINGTIVKAGGSIEGSTVVRIEEEYIVMRTDGVRWKLK